MQTKSCFIFDFDGTLIDSYAAVIEKFNRVAEELNFRKIPSEDLLKVKDFSSRELIHYLSIPFYKIPIAIHRARKYIQSDMEFLAPFTMLPEVLHELHARDIFLGILTSNSAENVNGWLKRHHLHHVFNFIHTESGFFAKKRMLKKLIQTYELDKTKTFYIGDETRDIEAAKKNAIFSVAVTWGFNSKKILSQHHPHYLFDKPEDLLFLCGNKGSSRP